MSSELIGDIITALGTVCAAVCSGVLGLLGSLLGHWLTRPRRVPTTAPLPHKAPTLPGVAPAKPARRGVPTWVVGGMAGLTVVCLCLAGALIGRGFGTPSGPTPEIGEATPEFGTPFPGGETEEPTLMPTFEGLETEMPPTETGLETEVPTSIGAETPAAPTDTPTPELRPPPPPTLEEVPPEPGVLTFINAVLGVPAWVLVAFTVVGAVAGTWWVSQRRKPAPTPDAEE